MTSVSAGILMYRLGIKLPEIFLAHPGGPFFSKKDNGVWTIPKGLPEVGENILITAIREFEEETGFKPDGEFIPLGSIKQKGGKIVHAWAVECDIPEDFILKSNYFELSWPPASGQMKKFPEVDRAEFFPVDIAKEKIIPAQIPLIERLEQKLKDEALSL